MPRRRKNRDLAESLDTAMRTSSALSVLVSQAVAARAGINSTDLECLDILNLMGPMSAGQLAETTGLTTGAVTGVVDRLERAGYVRRESDPNDRRRVIVQPETEVALAKFAPYFAPLSNAMDKLYSQYTEQELALLLDFVTRCNEVVTRAITELRSGSDG